MMLLQYGYSRCFNQGHRRDGPLWRSRFLSKLVEGSEYWQIPVRYIDQNPFQAVIVDSPDRYGMGNASHYAKQSLASGRVAPWLCLQAT